jgi:lipopolysaccharide export system permease protein
LAREDFGRINAFGSSNEMNLLHRHIFGNVATTCLSSVGLFAAVLILGNTLNDMVGYLMAGQISLGMFFYLIGLMVPYVAAYALPMGVLLGVLLVLGRMSAQQEITAMRAAGLSLGFIARPVLVFGCLAAAVALIVNFEFMPRARMAYKQILAEAVQTNPLSFIVPQTFVRDFPNLVIYVEGKEGAILQDVWFWRLDNQQRVLESGRAREGALSFDEENAVLEVKLRDVVAVAQNENDPENYPKMRGTTQVGEVPLSFRVDDIFSQRKKRQKYAWMTYAELRAEREQSVATGDDSKRLGVAMAISEKGANALAVIGFAFLAIPLGLRVSRQETSANLGVALILVMGYYLLTVMASWFKAMPALRPELLLWVPSLLCIAVGIWMLRRVDRA